MSYSESGVSGGPGRIPVAKEGELYSLKWHTFQTHFTNGLRTLFEEGSNALDLDVILSAEGQHIQSHKWLLSLCSPYFKNLFRINQIKNKPETIVILTNIKFKDLQNIIYFIYNGEVKVNNHELAGFLKAGEILQIEGLTSSGQNNETEAEQNHHLSHEGGVPAGSGHHMSHPPPPDPSLRHHQQPSFRHSQSGSGVPSPVSVNMKPNLTQQSASVQQSIVPPAPKRSRYSATVTSASATSLPQSTRPSMGVSSTVSSGYGNAPGIMGIGDSSNSSGGGVHIEENIVAVDPLAIDPGAGVEMAGVGAHQDPLGGGDGHGHGHGIHGEEEAEDEQMIQIDAIKSEAGGIFANEPSDEEEDEEQSFDIHDHGDSSSMGEVIDGIYQSGSISVEAGLDSLPGPSSGMGGAGGSQATPKPPVWGSQSSETLHSLAPGRKRNLKGRGCGLEGKKEIDQAEPSPEDYYNICEKLTKDGEICGGKLVRKQRVRYKIMQDGTRFPILKNCKRCSKRGCQTWCSSKGYY